MEKWPATIGEGGVDEIFQIIVNRGDDSASSVESEGVDWFCLEVDHQQMRCIAGQKGDQRKYKTDTLSSIEQRSRQEAVATHVALEEGGCTLIKL